MKEKNDPVKSSVHVEKKGLSCAGKCVILSGAWLSCNLWLHAVKEGFNVKSGKSLKAVRLRGSDPLNVPAEEGLVFRSF